MVYTHDLHRFGRRWPDAPAGRAGGKPARNAEHVHMASVRPVESAVAWKYGA